MNFKVDLEAVKKEKRIIKSVSLRIDPDLVDAFEILVEKSGLPMNTVINQMIRHCLNTQEGQ